MIGRKMDFSTMFWQGSNTGDRRIVDFKMAHGDAGGTGAWDLCLLLQFCQGRTLASVIEKLTRPDPTDYYHFVSKDEWEKYVLWTREQEEARHG
jgi:hypothetical protein